MEPPPVRKQLFLLQAWFSIVLGRANIYHMHVRPCGSMFCEPREVMEGRCSNLYPGLEGNSYLFSCLFSFPSTTM